VSASASLCGDDSDSPVTGEGTGVLVAVPSVNTLPPVSFHRRGSPPCAVVMRLRRTIRTILSRFHVV